MYFLQTKSKLQFVFSTLEMSSHFGSHRRADPPCWTRFWRYYTMWIWCWPENCKWFTKIIYYQGNVICLTHLEDSTLTITTIQNFQHKKTMTELWAFLCIFHIFSLFKSYLSFVVASPKSKPSEGSLQTRDGLNGDQKTALKTLEGQLAKPLDCVFHVFKAPMPLTRTDETSKMHVSFFKLNLTELTDKPDIVLTFRINPSSKTTLYPANVS